MSLNLQHWTYSFLQLKWGTGTFHPVWLTVLKANFHNCMLRITTSVLLPPCIGTRIVWTSRRKRHSSSGIKRALNKNPIQAKLQISKPPAFVCAQSNIKFAHLSYALQLLNVFFKGITSISVDNSLFQWLIFGLQNARASTLQCGSWVLRSGIDKACVCECVCM